MFLSRTRGTARPALLRPLLAVAGLIAGPPATAQPDRG